MRRRIRSKINQNELFVTVRKARERIIQSEILNQPAMLPKRKVGGYAEHKLSILRGYFYAYSAIVSNHFKRFTYFETCAGPGVCEIRGSGRLVLGTPLMAMTNSPQFTRYVFIEKDHELADALKERTKYHCPGVEATVIEGDCNDSVQSILSSMSPTEPVLIVMDPEGLELKWENTIVPAALHPRSELFINFPYDMAIKRCISPDAYEATERTVTQYMGTDAWKELRDGYMNQEMTSDELRNALLGMYTEGLRNLGLKEIQVSKLVRSDNNHPLYFLVSASRKRVATKIMKDIMRVPTMRQQTITEGD